jgi:hypothetical protein
VQPAIAILSAQGLAAVRSAGPAPKAGGQGGFAGLLEAAVDAAADAAPAEAGGTSLDAGPARAIVSAEKPARETPTAPRQREAKADMPVGSEPTLRKTEPGTPSAQPYTLPATSVAIKDPAAVPRKIVAAAAPAQAEQTAPPKAAAATIAIRSAVPATSAASVPPAASPRWAARGGTAEAIRTQDPDRPPASATQPLSVSQVTEAEQAQPQTPISQPETKTATPLSVGAARVGPGRMSALQPRHAANPGRAARITAPPGAVPDAARPVTRETLEAVRPAVSQPSTPAAVRAYVPVNLAAGAATATSRDTGVTRPRDAAPLASAQPRPVTTAAAKSQPGSPAAASAAAPWPDASRPDSVASNDAKEPVPAPADRAVPAAAPAVSRTSRPAAPGRAAEPLEPRTADRPVGASALAAAPRTEPKPPAEPGAPVARSAASENGPVAAKPPGAPPARAPTVPPHPSVAADPVAGVREPVPAPSAVMETRPAKAVPAEAPVTAAAGTAAEQPMALASAPVEAAVASAVAGTAPAPPGPAVPAPAAPSAAGPAPAAPAPAAQVAPALLSMARSPDGGQQMTLRLHPAELGMVQVDIDRGSAGGAAVRISVEKPDTMQALLRDQPQLHKALDDAGVPSTGRTVTFTLAPDAPLAASGNPAPDSGPGGRHDPAPRAGDSAPAAGTGQGGAEPQGGGRSGYQSRDQDTYAGGRRGGSQGTSASGGGQTAGRQWLRVGLDITA